LCKKTFARNRNIKVVDIAEIVLSRLNKPTEIKAESKLKAELEVSG
jgi:hypothetical protein